VSGTAFLFSLFAVWIVVGVVSAFVMGRRGHAPFNWLILGAVLGPLVIPVALSRTRDARGASLNEPDRAAHRGPVDVLVGMDGSAESLSAAEVVADLLGERIGRLTLATVVDYDTAMVGTAGPTHRSAEEELARAAAHLGQRLGSDVDVVVLAGRPAEVLAAHATDSCFDVLAIGSRGRGASRLVRGSVATRLSRGASLPVLVVTAHHQADTHTTS
jgi:nucleotide-binding universal stress UspA family protein